MGNKWLVWAVIILAAISLMNLFTTKQAAPSAMTYSAFMEYLNQGVIESADIQNNEITGVYRTVRGDRTQYHVIIPNNDTNLPQNLLDHKVDVEVKKAAEMPIIFQVLISWFPMLLLIGVWIFFMRQMQGGGKGGPMSFGKSRAKMLNEEQKSVSFEDVAGCEEAKMEVTEVVEFLRDPSRFTRLGGRIPKGVLLVGPPGTGKTLLARAIAGEAEVPFFSISGSDFVEMFVGVGASRVRDMFEQAKTSSPCIVFVDEIDAMGRHRGAGIGGGNDEREQTLNQMLVEMDGFEANEGVILVAATNRPDVLDPALLRPGRFDRQVVVPIPDIRGREQILTVHMRKVPLGDNVEPNVLARGTPGFSGADLANLVNEAALNAARNHQDDVYMQDFEAAKDKVMMGTERRSMIISEDQKRTTAYHEAGHTLVAKHVKNTDPVHKVSIIPRGRSLGITMQLPDEDQLNHERGYLRDRIAILMGGRLGEELVLNQMTTGASNDFERATQLARSMVTMWGMSDKLGAMVYGEREDEVFLGREITRHNNISERTAQSVDEEVRLLIDKNYAYAKQILVDHMNELHNLANALMEYESLDRDEIDLAMAGETIIRKEIPKTPSKAKSSSSKTDDHKSDESKDSKNNSHNPEPDLS
ncbi:MAG: ATP-dependent zinc metalloprotease FtsH [Mariprofundales bacterium]